MSGVLAVLAVGVLSASALAVAEDLPSAAAWKEPQPKEVRGQAMDWLKERSPGGEVLAKAEAIWADSDAAAGPDLLDRLARTFALTDGNARNLVELCSHPRASPKPAEQAWLADAKTPPLVARNLRLYYAIWLVQQTFYDEALEQLTGLHAEDVADPASLLFYRGVVYHELLDKKDGLASLDSLLAASDRGPKRYAAVARLMREDLKRLQEDSLDHIARRMEDIQRRLALGRGGPKVRKVEDGVIESLDKLIKDLEEAQRKQQQQSASGSGNIQSQSPAPDSRILGGKGPGEVTKKNIGSKSGWGDLPPKAREEAMQQIGREFPSHYRDAVEQYFRRLAGESERKQP